MNTLNEGKFEDELKRRIWDEIKEQFLDEIYLPSEQNASSGMTKTLSLLTSRCRIIYCLNYHFR